MYQESSGSTCYVSCKFLWPPKSFTHHIRPRPPDAINNILIWEIVKRSVANRPHGNLTLVRVLRQLRIKATEVSLSLIHVIALISCFQNFIWCRLYRSLPLEVSWRTHLTANPPTQRHIWVTYLTNVYSISNDQGGRTFRVRETSTG